MAAFYQTFATPGVRSRECAPAACPVCGGLECLCRPRFFAGQLLTDEDLNLLDRYITGKNKLHNRHLVGWGVVCGLEAVCNPCNMVTVRPGYALSPCGEDIVVCAEAVVDVCALIKRCRDEERRRWECEPFGAGQGNPDCRDVTEEWVLTVRYEEKPSRGVTPLKGSGSSCGCGGSSSGGCGCGGGGGSKTCGCGSRGGGSSRGSSKGGGSCGCGTPQGKKSAPAQCEPTVTCEGYVFEVCKVTPRMKNDDRRPDPGAIVTRFMECLRDFFEAMPQVPSNNPQNPGPASAWREWCCDLKEALLDYLASHPVYDCLLAERLAQFQCPELTPNNQQNYHTQVQQAVTAVLVPVAAEYIRYCLCAALLPPCPAPVEDPRVPLAAVTVRRDNCRVVRVCNLSHRKFVTTFPNLQYWLSWIPVMRQFRVLLERVCCGEFDLRRPGTDNPDVPTPTPPPPGATTFASAAEGTGGASPASDTGTEAGAGGTDVSWLKDNTFAQLVVGAWARREKSADAQTLFMASVGMTDEQGQPLMSQKELENPFLFLALNQVAQPAFARVPSEAPAVARNVVRAGVTKPAGETTGFAREAGAESGGGGDIEELRRQLAELQETVRLQQERIGELDSRTQGNQ